jgi:hypothetical protein
MEGEMTDTQDNRRGARRLWLWPVAVLVSFPIGGYLADLVVGESIPCGRHWSGVLSRA